MGKFPSPLDTRSPHARSVARVPPLCVAHAVALAGWIRFRIFALGVSNLGSSVSVHPVEQMSGSGSGQVEGAVATVASSSFPRGFLFFSLLHARSDAISTLQGEANLYLE